MKSNNTRICLELPLELYEQIKVKAKFYNLSATAFIRLILKKEIENGEIRKTLV